MKLLNGECAATFPDSIINLDPIGKEDFQIILKMKQENLVPDGVALSFSTNSIQLNEFRRIINSIWSKQDITVFAKSENKQGLDNLDDIVTMSDGLFIARSYLLLYLQSSILPMVQRKILKRHMITVNFV